ncbi:hypothetical protein CPB83DRAFT_886157 [Crepidotus variabilis]|uniref:Uncharacterized protein n=1 Tax=Crepidotus variabilis TaxID=179855 RepID=A0A9P6E8T5_9AGAR|nr:hypothetical protein CPB83DRAFT_886157 [Crepidotus variabilis]
MSRKAETGKPEVWTVPVSSDGESGPDTGGNVAKAEAILLNGTLEKADAERRLLLAIEAREKGIKGTMLDQKTWTKASTRAGRIVKIGKGRAKESADNLALAILFALYNNKHQLASVYTKLERFDEAQQILEHLMEVGIHQQNPILVASRELLVTVYLNLGKFEEAELV